MHFSVTTAVVGLATISAALPQGELWTADNLNDVEPVDAVPMEDLRAMKLKFAKEQEEAGFFDAGRYPSTMAAKKCEGGKAGDFKCQGVDLMGFLSHEAMKSKTRAGNDVWGWTSPDGREIAIIGQRDNTGFAEVMKDGSLVFLANLPTASGSDMWRDIKTIGDYAYIVADVANHGMQVVDMKKILAIDPKSPKTLSKSDLTAHYTGFGACHNVVATASTNTVYCALTMSNNCGGRLAPVDVSDPANPKGLPCIKGGARVHDAMCVIYDGPDTKYKGKEICLDFDEKQFTIVDMTDKNNGKEVAKKTYNGLRYTHQGWWTDNTHRFILLGDELDEGKTDIAKDMHTRTFIIDAKDLANPVFTGVYRSPAKAIDHNLFIIDGIAYMANYNAGMRVVDARSLAEDPTGKGMKEIAYFDIYPDDDNGKEKLGWVGSWGVYPYFKSGHIIISGIERGAFSVKLQKGVL